MTINDVLAALVTCLCEQIEAEGLPTPCFCGLVPGEAAAQDYIGDCEEGLCGMAWVRLVNIYPSSQVGVADTTVGNCSKGIGADVEIGIVRCIKAGQDNGEPPTQDELLTATLLQVQDALVMHKAVSCCPGLNQKDFVMGQYEPIGPGGGVVGGTWILSVAV